MEYSLLNRGIEEEVLPAARALGLGVFPWSPLGSRRAHREVPHRNPFGLARRFGRVLRLRRSPISIRVRGRIVEAVSRAADGLGWSPLEVALTWVRDREGVTAPIVGARTAQQLSAALATESMTLPAEIAAALDDVSLD